NGGATGSLGTTPVAHGVDCKSTLGGDAACATVNDPTNGKLDPPWDTANKNGGSTNEVSEFFEGGVNLTAAHIGGKCFNTFIGDTRSSQSLTATLFDFARGVLGECGASVTTTPSQSTRQLGSTDPITDLADIAGTATDTSAIVTNQKWLPNDTATVTTAGGTAVSGTVTFSLFENADCSGTPKATFTDSSAPFETNNTTVYTSSLTISWKAHFEPNN